MQVLNVGHEFPVASRRGVIERSSMLAIAEQRFRHIPAETAALAQSKPELPVFISETFQRLVVAARVVPILLANQSGISEIVAVQQSIEIVLAGPLLVGLRSKHLKIGVGEGRL